MSSPPLPPDPYAALKVSRDAGIAQIRSAHRKLVLQCHPDRIRDPSQKAAKKEEFQAVQQAYELLSDENRRQKYDEDVKLADLRRQMRTKVNISSPRSSPRYEFEIRTKDARPSAFRTGTAPATPKYPNTRSRDEDDGRGPRIFEPQYRPPRRESTFPRDSWEQESDKRNASWMEKARREREAKEAELERLRELERDRERTREREEEKERKREQRRRAEEEARREKEAKEARRAERKKRDKARDKEIKREAEDKKRHAKPYVEPYDDDATPPPRRSDREKKSSSSKLAEDMQADNIASYINSKRATHGSSPGLQRSSTFHGRHHMPKAATPPPMRNRQPEFAEPEDMSPDEDIYRSSAKPRRGSAGESPLGRERGYRSGSRDPRDEPIIMTASPKMSTRQSKNQSSPPRQPTRTKTMPTSPMPEATYTRPMPGMTRSQTFNVFSDEKGPRGRGRSRYEPQVTTVDPESDEEAYRRSRESKHRGSRKTRSPEAYDGTRKTRSGSSRKDPDMGFYEYYAKPGIRVVETRPTMVRETSYSATPGSGGAKFSKVKTSRTYSRDDVQYSKYPHEAYSPDRRYQGYA